MPDLNCDTHGLATPRTAVSVGQDDSLILALGSQGRCVYPPEPWCLGLVADPSVGNAGDAAAGP